MWSKKLISLDLCLRILLFAASLTAMVVMVTSNQNKFIQTPVYSLPIPAKYTYSPSYIYFVVALALSTLYSILTGIASSWILAKPSSSKKLFKFYLVLISQDVLMLGVVVAATACAGAVGYIGLRGNSHAGWSKICDVYGKFCRHIGVSVVVSMLASVLLASLVILSAYSVYCLAQMKGSG